VLRSSRRLERRAALGAGFAVWLAAASLSAQTPAAEASLPPSPFRVMHRALRTPPYLDATSACLPPSIAGAPEIAAQLRAGDIGAVMRALARRGEGGAESDLRLLRAVVAARTGGASARDGIRLTLVGIAASDPRPPARACARLERARLSLLLGRPFDARVDRSQARRLGDAVPAERALDLSWLEAEELHRTGDDAKAVPLWQALAGGAEERLALAARLRLVESRFPVGGAVSAQEAKAAWASFPALLESASAARLDIEPWSLVAGELAIRAGDLSAAHYWLARAELAWRGGLASIRKADVLVALGRVSDARNTLARVARAAHAVDVRDLAELRIAALDLDAGRIAPALARAQRPARSLHPIVRAEALLLIARAELAGGRANSALDDYLQVARTSELDELAPRLREGLTVSLRELTRDGVRCAAVLQELGSRTALLARNAAEVGPLLRIGDCFLQLRMPGAALDSYRELAPRFGADPEAALPLRMATAALAAGDLEAVRRALDEQLAKPDRPGGRIAELRWQWLAFALADREGRSRDGLDALERLASAPELPADVRADVEEALIARLDRAGEAARARTALAASLALSPELESGARGYAWLRLADLALSERDTPSAQAAYARAAALLEPGPLQDRARHHGALLAATKQERRDALALAAKVEPGSAWSRVAELELRIQRLAEQVDGEQARLP
jgi:hypothetical protein